MELIEWKDSPIFPERYEISSTGLVRSKIYVKTINRNGKIVQWLTKPKILSPAVNKDGYKHVSLRFNNVAKSKLVHRLVAEAFLGNHSESLEINHKDSNRLNNDVSNLEWITHRQNVLHSYEKGFNSNAMDKHPRAVLSVELVSNMKKDFKAGLSYRAIATKYDRLYTTVWAAINGRNWKDV